MAPDYRHSARESLKRAKAELAANDPHRTRYAALELRDAMEALTYDRALAFKAEIPPEEYKTWQPRKLMMVLHDIDPTIGMTSSLAVGIEEEFGKPAPAKNMKFMGTDVVLTLADLKRHYDGIAAGLHVPSFDQLEKGTQMDPAKLRARCEQVVGVVEKVLASPVWNNTMGDFAEIACMRCGVMLRKRIPVGKPEIEARCFECQAEYLVKDAGPGQTHWFPNRQEIKCQAEGCGASMVLWADQIHPDHSWNCEACGQGYRIYMRFTMVNAGQAEPATAA